MGKKLDPWEVRKRLGNSNLSVEERECIEKANKEAKFASAAAQRRRLIFLKYHFP